MEFLTNGPQYLSLKNVPKDVATPTTYMSGDLNYTGRNFASDLGKKIKDTEAAFDQADVLEVSRLAQDPTKGRFVRDRAGELMQKLGGTVKNVPVDTAPTTTAPEGPIVPPPAVV
jgi:hypothetical protein